MILVAGLTPAWQQIMRFDGLRLGQVNRAAEVLACASGKVLNVAIALHHLGAPAETIAPLGGPARAAIEREFAALSIHAHWIATHHPTRVCTSILDSRRDDVTELVENAGPMTTEELGQFRATYATAAGSARAAVLTGSLPIGAPHTLIRDLLAATPCPTVLDVRGKELLAALPVRPWMVKPNREELGQTLGVALEDEAALAAAMRDMNDRGAIWVLVTHGAEPVWASSAGRLYRFRPLAVDAVNPIGCGDCLAAGIAWGNLQGADPLDAIRLGIAAAADNARRLLPARLDRAWIETARASVVVENL